MFLRKILKVLSVIILTLILLFVIIVLTINLAPVRKQLVRFINNYLQQSEIPVHLGVLNTIRFRQVDLSDILIAGEKKDTILYAGNLDVRFNLRRIFRKQVTVLSFEARDLKLRLIQENYSEPLNLVMAFSKQQSKDKPVQDSGSWSFDIHRIKIGSLDLSYHSKPNKMMLNLTLQDADLEIDKSNLKEKELMVRSIKLNALNTALYTPKTENKPDTTTSQGFPWKIGILEIDIVNSSFKSGKYPQTYPGIFEPQMVLSAFQSELSDISLKSDELGVNIIQTSFDLDNGFVLKDLQGKIISRPTQSNVELYILTNRSKLHLSGQSDTFLLDIDAKNDNSGLSIHDSRIDLADLLYFNPELNNAAWFKEYGTNPVSVYATIFQNGTITRIDTFSLYQSKNLWLSLNGRISDISEPEISKKAELSISSSMGDLTLDGNINPAEERIDARIFMNNIRPGVITKQDVVKEINGSVVVNVNGFNSDRLFSDFTLNLHSVNIKDHIYDQIILDGKITPRKYSVSTRVTDAAVMLDLMTHVVRNNNTLSILTDGNLRFTPVLIGFGKDTITVTARMSGSVNQSVDHLNTSLELADVSLKKRGTESHINSLQLNMYSDTLNTRITGNSNFMDVEFAMQGPINNIGVLIKDLGVYFKSLAANFTLDSAFNTFNIPVAGLNAHFRYHPVLNMITNDTSLRFSNASVLISSNEQEGKFYGYIRSSGIQKGNLSVGNFETSIKDSAGTVNLAAELDSINLSSQYLEGIDFSHRSVDRENSGQTILSVNDRDKLNIQIEIISLLEDSVLTVTVPTSQVILNGITWRTSQPELFQYNRFKGELLPQVTLTTDSAALMLATVKENSESGFNAEFDQVELSSLVPSALLPDSISAIINGAVRYRTRAATERQIDADLVLSHVAWSDIKLNRLGIKGYYNSTGTDTFNMVSDITLDSADIHFEGNRSSALDRELTISLSDFPVKIFKPFVKESLSELSGDISGDLSLVSDGENQSFEGELNLNDIRMRIAAINSLFRIPDNTITLDGNRINFDRFVILDSLDNKLSVNGNIDFANRDNINTRIDISTPEMLVMNSTRENNESFYGTILAGTNISVTGPIRSPKVQGTLSVNKGTEIFYANQPGYSLQDMTETVTFINSGSPAEKESEEIIVKQRSTIGASVNIDPQAIIHFSLQDQLYDIRLEIQGGGMLNYNVFSNNQSNLSGVYEISEGNADLRIRGFSEKEFSIREGSIIRWIDKIDDPEMQIEAQNTVTGKYKNPTDKADRIVEFNVVLKLTNRLSSLNVLMTVATEDQYLMSIINSMSPEEQMKQAVSLLLFQTINIPGIYTTSNQINDQVNQIVESQLNKLTQASIKDFDISLGVDSYTTPTESGTEETQTSLSYGIKKDILNDRASVEISGRLNNGQQGGNDYAASNFTFEYRLDSAATKYIKVYRQRSYEDILEGEVERTGFGIIFRKTFKSISDIWKGNRNKKSGK